MLTELYQELLAHGGRGRAQLSPMTVHHVHRILCKALNDAVRVDRMLYTNPAAQATRPRRQVKGRQLWTLEELREFLDVAATHRLGSFYRLSAYTGARRGELLNLTWADLRLDAAEMTISGSASTLAGKRVYSATKTGRSRTLTLDAGTVDVMGRHLNAQLDDRVVRGRSWPRGRDLVFRREDGEPLHTDTPSQLMPRLVAMAGLPPARLHDLRHVHASALLLAGVPIQVVAARLGHAHPAMTLRIYAHVIGGGPIEGADAFAAAVEDARWAACRTSALVASAPSPAARPHW